MITILAENTITVNKIEPDISKIPQDMKALRQWICFKLEWNERNKKWDKIPKNPLTGGGAMSNKPSTWTDFNTALQCLNGGRFSGIGFVFTKESGIYGVDIDGCFSNGVMSPEAQEIIGQMESYTEWSPSKNGVHIIAKGILPPDGRRKGSFEMYDSGRFFTVTGWHVEGTPIEIYERTNEVAVVHAKYIAKSQPEPIPIRKQLPQSYVNISDGVLIGKILNSKQGFEFQSLWDGDTNKYNSDDSAADMALCNMLAFWTGRDHSRMDSLFRQSSLYREKWDERHFSDGTTYGVHTIAKAIMDCRNVYDPAFGTTNQAEGNADGGTSKQKAIFFEDGQFIPPLLSEYLLQEDHYLVERGGLFVYTNGVYRETGTDFIKRSALRLLDKHYRDSRGKEVAAYIKTKLWTEEPVLDVEPKYINVKNGLIDFSSNPPIVIPHTPDYKTEIQLPITYDPNADCPGVKKFFSDVLHNDCLELVAEIFGYFMIPDTRMQKAFLLKSSGESGKSIFLFLLTLFLGEENTSNETLQDLSENRFRVANLAGKLANIFADIPNRPIEETDTFKTLVAGDWKSAEKKHAPPFKFKNKARLIFSCNEIPRSKDNTHGFFRRWIILDFPNIFPVGNPKRDLNLLSKISTQIELSGLLNLAISGLQRLLKRGSFDTPASSEKELMEYRLANDSAKAFLCESIFFVNGSRLLRASLYESYKDYCYVNELKPFSAQNFYRKVREEYPSIQETNTGGRSFIGIQVNNEFCNRFG